MRGLIRSAILSAAAGAVLFPLISNAQVAMPDAAAPAATQPATAATAVPVKVVVLFSSGVGYFQHSGNVSGDADTVLPFKSAQINDVLKSLILDDGGGGSVPAVTYPSQDPLDKTLKSFGVDITANPSLADLLNQLRGARVTLDLGTDKLAGTVLGIEQRQKPAGQGQQPITVPVLNVFSGTGIRSVELTEVRNLSIDSPELQDELTKALSALAQARDVDKKPVTIHFKGNGARPVQIGYVVETPIWKTSYRLVLDPPDANAPAGDKAPATQPAEGKGGHLQGWAIVENQTDNDWDNVQLSLVSGRPISFIEDLYQPLYIPRPTVVPELFASLMPRTYGAGNTAVAGEAESFGIGGGGGAGARSRGANRDMAFKSMSAAVAAPMALADANGVATQPMDALHSIQSVASAAKVGELFQYTVGSVSLPRQKSAMIPIVTDPVGVERLSIYNESVLPRNPLNGARLTNTTKKHLLTGPITVLDASTYAGDAQIDNLPPGQNRLISYGVDLQMLVDAKSGDQTDELVTGKIVKGLLELTHKYVRAKTYTAENKSDHVKTLLIEHPLTAGWDLVDTVKPDEKTDALYRFKGDVKAGGASKLVVREQSVQDQDVVLLDNDVNSLIALSRSGGAIPDDVRKAIEKAAAMKQAVADTQRHLDECTAQVAEITADQRRIDETLRTIDRTTKLYSRLLNTLNDQETQLETLRADVKDSTKKKDSQQNDLVAYLAVLSVG